MEKQNGSILSCHTFQRTSKTVEIKEFKSGRFCRLDSLRSLAENFLPNSYCNVLVTKFIVEVWPKWRSHANQNDFQSNLLTYRQLSSAKKVNRLECRVKTLVETNSLKTTEKLTN